MPEEDIIGGYSKEELEKAIGEKEKRNSTAALDIKEAQLKIQKVEQAASGRNREKYGKRCGKNSRRPCKGGN